MKHNRTFNGGMVISTAQQKFGNSSWLFNGSGYVTIAANDDLNFNGSIFTVDFWVRINAYHGSGFNMFVGKQGFDFFYRDSNGLVYISDGTTDSTFPWAPSLNTWYHMAATYDGANYRLYVNGTQIDTAKASSGGTAGATAMHIGSSSIGTNPLSAYIDEFRISKGIVRWTSNFIPPDQPYTADSYTVLLCHCEADMLGTGAHNVTTVGTPIMSPLAPNNYGGSVEFNGSSGLSIPASGDFEFGTGDFTVDGYFYVLTTGSTMFLTPSSGGSLQILTNGASSWRIYVANVEHTFSAAIPQSTWFHFALVRYSGVLRLFINGTQVGSDQAETGVAGGGGDLQIAYGSGFYGQFRAAGLRLSKGLARWISNFTPPSAPYSKPIGGVDGYTKLMLHMDNGNNSAVFTDSSFTPKTVVVLDAVQKSDQMMFGRSCAYLNGGTAILYCANSADWDLGSGDFCIEGWIRPSTVGGGGSGTVCAVDKNVSHAVANYAVDLFIDSSGYLKFYVSNGSSQYFVSNNASLVGAWHHFAAVRYSGTIYLYIDGTSVGTPVAVSGSLVYDSNTKLSLGNRFGTPNQQPYQGYIDEFRFTKGESRYTTNFTPNTKPFDAPNVDSYTKLLLPMNGTNGSTQFPDLSPTGKAVTSQSGAAISTAQYKFNGSSVFFNGTNSYLDVPASVDFSFGTEDFTIEFWVNFAAASNAAFFNQGSYFRLYCSYGGSLTVTGSSTTVAAAWTQTTNTWYHVAVSRTAGVMRLFVDGQSLTLTTNDGPGASIGNIYTTQIGKLDVGGYPTNAYLQDFRISKGIGRYTANFAPPVRPYGS